MDKTNEHLERTIRLLRSPFRNADDKDWRWLIDRLGDGEHGQFWKGVMTEMRGALMMTDPK